MAAMAALGLQKKSVMTIFRTLPTESADVQACSSRIQLIEAVFAESHGLFRYHPDPAVFPRTHRHTRMNCTNIQQTNDANTRTTRIHNNPTEYLSGRAGMKTGFPSPRHPRTINIGGE